MVLELSRLQGLRVGPPGVSTYVGDVPVCVSNYLKTAFRSVNISRSTFDKNQREHPDLTDFDYLQLPYVLEHGLWMQDVFSGLCAVASCPSDNGLVRYKAVVKRPTESPELWLTTFHRLNPRQTKRLIERGGAILRAYRP